MFRTQLVIAGLTKQKDMLSELVEELENNNNLELEDCLFYHERTNEIVGNLRKLRKINQSYLLLKDEDEAVIGS